MVGSADPQGAKQEGVTEGVGRAATRSYSPIQLLFLHRLTQLLRQRREYQKLLDPDALAGDWRMKLLSKSIYSTYCDCVSLELEADAKRLLRKACADQTVN